MAQKQRGLALGLVPLAILATAPLALAQGAGQGLEKQIVGQWDLVSISVNGAQPYGAAPKGSMLIDDKGHYAVIILGGQQGNSFSYYGAYTLSGSNGQMNLHIEGGTRASAAGRDVRRAVAINGDEMVQSTVPGGSRGVVKVTWKRAK